ncbi:hypothetical protein D9M71_271950 [compost metagenome]
MSEIMINSAEDWNDEQVKEHPVRGRINLTLRVDPPDSDSGVEIQLRKLFFVWKQSAPHFALFAKGEDEHAGTELYLSGYGLEAGKTYVISDDLMHVSARFEREGTTSYPRTPAEGTLTIRSIDSESIEGYFRFVFNNTGKEDKRKIDVYGTSFTIGYSDVKVS